MTLTRLSLTTALVLTMPGYALAAVDDAGAQALSLQLKDGLHALMFDQLGDGNLQVKPDGDAFAVTLPVFTINNADGDFTARVPAIALRMTPNADSSSYTYTATLPSPFLTFSDKEGAERATVAAAEQQITGEWNVKDHYFPSAVALLKGIAVTDLKKELTTTIAQISANQQIAPSQNGLFNIQGSFDVRDVKIGYSDSSKPGTSATIKIAGLGFTQTSKDYDLASLRRFNAEAQNMQEGPKTTADIRGRIGSMFGIASQAGFGATDAGFVLSGLDVLIKGTPDEPQATHIALPLLRITGNSTTAENKLVGMNFKYEHSGLAASPLPSAVIGELLPAAAKLDISVKNLPVSELLVQTGEAISGTIPADKPADGSAPAPAKNPRETLHTALATMEKAGTTLSVNDISFTAKAINALSQGTLNVSQASPIGAVGTVNTRINGVTELIEKLSQAMQATPAANGQPQAQPDTYAQGAVMALTMLQMQGQPVANAAPSGLTYKLELTPAGDVKMNGNTMFSMAANSQPDNPVTEEQPAKQ